MKRNVKASLTERGRKGKKSLARYKKHDDKEEGQLPQASSISHVEANMQLDSDSGPTCEVNLDLIFKELQEFWKDSNSMGYERTLVESTEEWKKRRQESTQLRSESSRWEDVLSELVKLQIQTETKSTNRASTPGTHPETSD